MIVARGMGRGAAAGLIVAFGLGLTSTVIAPPVEPGIGGGGIQIPTPMLARGRALQDDRDMIEMLPIVVGVLNATRH